MDGSTVADLKSVVAPLNFLVPMAEKSSDAFIEGFQDLVPGQRRHCRFGVVPDFS